MRTYTKTPSTLRRPGQRGFTLVELLLVLVILGTLAAIVLPQFRGTGERAKRQACQTQLGVFKTALSTFEVDNGYYPRSLEDLVTKPSEAPSWHGPYLEGGRIPMDPWQQPFVYECPGKHDPNGYDVYSFGFDGQEGTEDDISNWQDPNQPKQQN